LPFLKNFIEYRTFQKSAKELFSVENIDLFSIVPLLLGKIPSTSSRGWLYLHLAEPTHMGSHFGPDDLCSG